MGFMTNLFHIEISDEEIKKISTLGLAHLGDAVYELLVRSYLCAGGKATPKGLHRATIEYVSATAQAAALDRLLPELTEDELAIYKRGRNANVNTIPKSAKPDEYRKATGLEALFGTLYLKGRRDRINELFFIIINGG